MNVLKNILKLKFFSTYQFSLVVAFCFTVSSCSNDFVSPATPSGSTIVDLTSTSDDFNLFVAALSKTGLASTLDNNNSGQFTVFAPNDAAFVNFFNALVTPTSNTVLPPGSPAAGTLDETAVKSIIDNLEFAYPIPPNPALPANTSYLTIGTLSSIMAYHLVSSKVLSNEITGSGQVFSTMQNSRLSTSVQGADALLNANLNFNNSGNGAKIIAVDNVASNGVIHTIDRVLRAPSSASSLASLGYTSSATVQPINYATNPPTINGGNTPDAVDTDYDLFAIALRKTELCFTVYPNKSPLPDYTIFAPRDLPFRTFLATLNASVTSEATAQSFINGLSDSTTPTLQAFKDIIKYHIVAGRIVSTDLSNGQQLTTLLTSKAFTVNVGGTITLTDLNGASPDATVVSSNILTNAGIVHGLDNVLLPN